jgi:hypothetical protein
VLLVLMFGLSSCGNPAGSKGAHRDGSAWLTGVKAPGEQQLMQLEDAPDALRKGKLQTATSLVTVLFGKQGNDAVLWDVMLLGLRPTECHSQPMPQGCLLPGMLAQAPGLLGKCRGPQAVV